jgi:hypothetical protein
VQTSRAIQHEVKIKVYWTVTILVVIYQLTPLPFQLYTLPSRLAFAGWTSASIAGYKGPTPVIVTGLATHTGKTLASDYCVSESGTAGPTGGDTRNRTPGYVALAVVKQEKALEGRVRVWTKEVETGSSEREENMVSFAVEALRLVAQAIKGEVGEGEVREEAPGFAKEEEEKL